MLSSSCPGHTRLYTDRGIVDTLAPVSNSILTLCPFMEVSSIMAGTLAAETELMCASSSDSSLLFSVEEVPSECVAALFWRFPNCCLDRGFELPAVRSHTVCRCPLSPHLKHSEERCGQSLRRCCVLPHDLQDLRCGAVPVFKAATSAV